MRNLILFIAACCGTLLAGCMTPCSGCRHCDSIAAATPCGFGGTGEMACAQIGSAVGSFAAAVQPACDAPAVQLAPACDAPLVQLTPACDAPVLSGGGHCGLDESCASKILKDWQQSTGLEELDSAAHCSPAACSAPTEVAGGGCTCGILEKSCAAPAGCAAPPLGLNSTDCGCSVGGGSCHCGTSANLTSIVAQPFVSSAPAPAPLAGTPEATVHSGTTDNQIVRQNVGMQSKTIDEANVFAPSIDESPSSQTPFPPPIEKPVQHSVEGVPVEGYPGKGCPVHKHATSPETPDVSSVPRKLPKTGLSGVLVGGGFDTNGTRKPRKRKPAVRQISRSAATRFSATQHSRQPPQVKRVSESPFDWKPKPKLQIKSNGWSAAPHELRVPASTPVQKPIASTKPASFAEPPTAVEEVQLLPIPPGF